MGIVFSVPFYVLLSFSFNYIWPHIVNNMFFFKNGAYTIESVLKVAVVSGFGISSTIVPVGQLD